MSNRKKLIQLAKKELLDDAAFIDVIELLQEKGCSSLEAEELTEQASRDLREEGSI